jgi:quercetin dioxygenase-like cupin family protein
MNNSNENMIFPKGEKIINNYFIGTAWLHMLVADDDKLNCVIGNVTFESGARNNWHKHPGGQILLITEGKGYFQEEGKPVQIIQKGDIVKIDPDVKHWHGATPDSLMTHIAISPNTQLGDVEWLQAVEDEEYNNLKF